MISTRIFKTVIAMLLLLAMTCSLFACNAKPSQKSFEKAYDGALDDVMSSIDNYYTNLEKYDPKNGSVDANISVELSEDLISMLRSMTAEDFEWVNDVKLGYSQIWKDEKISANIALDYNDKSVVSLDSIIDLAEGDMYMAIPVLAEKYIKLDADDSGIDLGYLQSVMSLDYTEVLPEQKVLEKLIERYYNVIMENIPEAEFTDKTLTVNGVSQECVEYTTEFTQEDIVELAIALLETVKDDEDIEDIFSSALEYANEMEIPGAPTSDIDPDDAYDAVIDGVKDAIDACEDALENDYATDDVALILTSYITPKLDVIGAKIKLVGASENQVIYIAKAQEKDDIGVQIYFENAGVKLYEIEGDLVDTGKVLSGTYEVFANGQSMLFVDLEDVDSKKLDKDGIFDGIISIAPSKGLIDAISAGSDIDLSMVGLSVATMSIKLDVEQNSSDEGKVTMSLMSGSTPYASVTVEAALGKGKSVKIPSSNDYTKDPADWAEDLDFDNLVDAIKESGLPDYIVDMLESNLPF